MIPLPVNQLAQEGWRVQVHNDKRTFTALSSNIKLRKLDTLKISHVRVYYPLFAPALIVSLH